MSRNQFGPRVGWILMLALICSGTQKWGTYALAGNGYGFYIAAINEVNEKDSEIALTGFMVEKFQRNTSRETDDRFSNVTMKQMEVDITSYYSDFRVVANAKRSSGSKYLHLTHYKNGTTVTLQNFQNTFPCTFDLTNFPHDQHRCYVVLSPQWQSARNLKQYDYDNYEFAEFIGDKPENEIYSQAWGKTSWSIRNVSLYQTHSDFFPRGLRDYPFIRTAMHSNYIVVEIEIERHSAFFHRVFVGPALVLLLAPVIFLLPSDDTKKLVYAAFLLAIVSIEAMHLEKIFPGNTTTEVPAMVVMLTLCGVLVFLCLFISGFLTSIERIGREHPLPHWVNKIIIGKLGYVLLVRVREQNANILPEVPGSKGTADDEDSEGLNTAGKSKRKTEPVHVKKYCEAMSSLASELKLSHYRKQRCEQWMALFAVINRIFFLLTTIMGICIFRYFV